MKRKMRFLAGTLALVMVCRYSEMGVLIANAEARSSHSYAANEDSWHSMMAEEIELYYNSFKEQTEFETDFYSQSNMLINSEKIKISYLVSARLSRQISGTSYEQTGTGVLYTRTGDVTINAGAVELTGLIVAKKIVIHADSIEERPEILVSCNDENQVKVYAGNSGITGMEIYAR